MPTGQFVDLDLTPSFHRELVVEVVRSASEAKADAIGVPVAVGEDPPDSVGLSPEALRGAGFAATAGRTTVVLTPDGPPVVLVGIGDGALTAKVARDAAAAVANAAPWAASLACAVPERDDAGELVQAIIEGVFLARYSFSIRHRSEGITPVDRLTIITTADVAEAVERGKAIVAAALLGRDLANAPGGQLTATAMGDIAQEVGDRCGLQVEVFDKDQLVQMGCGGLLGVNLGSVEPPRMIRLRYVPDTEPTGVLTLVGKGIMYDSGGIALKPGDLVHAAMKNDMTGAGAVLAAMSALRALGCRAAVIGYLMCTDNMPSGSALKLGDVISMRGGTTVEVLNTDAEGRLVMADALVLATEEHTDAIVDIATLTGACLRTLGTEVAGVMGNSSDVIAQVRAAGDNADEPVWELPLIRSYRTQLDSPIADMTNMGGLNAGSITAALFLEEFVDGTPWAHIDIAGTAQADAASRWVNRGATGFGTRLLIDLAENFAVPGHVAKDET